MALRKQLGVPAFVDINLRDPWWQRESVFSLMQGARWLKLNDHELAVLLQRTLTTPLEIAQAASDLRERCACEWVMVTLGAQGAMLISADAQFSAAAAPVDEIVDTVGAGDAFSAVILLGILFNWEPALSLQRAVDFAAAVCKQRGATSPVPTLYSTHLERWAA